MTVLIMAFSPSSCITLWSRVTVQTCYVWTAVRCMQIGSGHPASYAVLTTLVPWPRVTLPAHLHLFRGQKYVDLYLYSSMRLHGMVLN
jgi:hypothetical protein